MSLRAGLTAEQIAVIDHPGRRLVVRAAAGSGKTRVLVARYLKHVMEDSLSPDQVLAITYTKKAAAEMRRRIVEALRGAGEPEFARIAETGPISTFHAFCERTLRENAIAAELDPLFEVASGDAPGALIEEILREELLNLEEQPKEVQKYVRLAAGRGAYGRDPSIEGEVASRIREALDLMRGTLHRPQDLERVYASPQRYAAHLLAAMQVEPGLIATRNKIEVGAADPSSSEYEQLELACGLVLLTCAVWRELDRRLVQEFTLDFVLLEHRFIQLLERSPATVARIRAQYKVVLIDEAQDLNPVQHRLLELMGLETQMMVGDPQQSIYRFRQADVSLFLAEEQRADRLQLTTNFRSDMEVLRMVGAAFAGPWADEFMAMNPRPNAREGIAKVMPLAQEDSIQVARWIKQLVDAGRSPGDIHVLVRFEAQGRKVTSALRNIGLEVQHVGSKRFYTRMAIRDLANVLESVVSPENDFAVLAALHSPAVGLSLDSIVLLADHARNTETSVSKAIATFATPIEPDQVKVAQFLDWFPTLTREADRLRAWELVGEILNQTPFLAELAKGPSARQDLANVRKMQMMAVQERLVDPLDFAERIRRIQLIRHNEEDAPAAEADRDVITVLNIHQSKGLEFPVVVVPMTSHNLGLRSTALVADTRAGFVMLTGNRQKSVAGSWLKTRLESEQIREEYRVLYVAMTRAEEALYVAAESQGKGWSSFLAQGLDQAMPGFPSFLNPEKQETRKGPVAGA